MYTYNTQLTHFIALHDGHWLDDQPHRYSDVVQQIIRTWYSVHGAPHVTWITTTCV